MQPYERLFAINIDRQKCDNCGICIFECGSKVYQWSWDREQVLPSNQKACVECFICTAKCPHEAINLTLQPKNQAKAEAAKGAGAHV